MLILTVRQGPAGAAVRIVDPSATSPQSIAFDLATTDEAEALFHYLRAVKPSRIEIADPVNIPLELLNGLIGLDIPYDILVADAGLLGENHILSFGESRRSRPPEVTTPNSFGRHCEVDGEPAHRLKCLREIAAKADRLLAPCPQAEAFVARYFMTFPIVRLEIGDFRKHADRPMASHSSPRYGSRHRLGIIPIRSCVHEQRLMRVIATRLSTCCSKSTTVIIGGTLDDLGLMRIGNTFVTGSVDVSEIDYICRTYALGSLFICITRPLFGHPLQSSAQASGLPLAYFDWSNGRCTARSQDLLLDPLSPIVEVIGVLIEWMKAY